jgi:outer membrane protein assembly factor BamB
MGSPAVVGDRIFAATQKGSVYALDTLSGKILWQKNVGGATAGAVAAAGGAIYLAVGREIVAVSVSDGSILWRTPVATEGNIGTPSSAGGRVFAAVGLEADDPAAHAVVTLDAATGKLGWRYTSPTKAQIYTPAVAGDRAFVVGEDRLLVALDVTSGAVKWSSPRPSEISAAPVVVGSVVFVVGNDGPVEAIDATNGAALWSVPMKGIPFGPAVVDGYLLVGTDGGVLYAISGQ